MKTRIHIHQQSIRRNLKDGGNRPVVIVRNYKGSTHCHQAYILGPSRVVQGHLSCGARAWIETESEVRAQYRSVRQSP